MFQTRRPLGRIFYLLLALVIAATVRVYAAPQSGPALTSVIDTVYMADGSEAQGTLVITWPAFVSASGAAVAAGVLDVTLGSNGALNVALATNAADKPGTEKKDAAMSFLQNALAMTDAVAAREIINPENFRNGISKIIDGTVQCLNASTWCKHPWLLKNSLTAKWSKKLCARKPYKRRSSFWWTFSISQIPPILAKQEFFNSHIHQPKAASLPPKTRLIRSLRSTFPDSSSLTP
jgi:hypothetical protein